MVDFYSLGFLVFLIISLICYYTIFKKQQWAVALVTSIVFYLYIGKKNLIVLCFSALVIYICSVLMNKVSINGKNAEKTLKAQEDYQALSTPEKKSRLQELRKNTLNKKRVLLYLPLVIILGILCYTKYWSVLFNSGLGIVLPIGISFYTFMAIAYIVDIYNEKYQPPKSFLKFFLFISWFPHLIQGPIDRYDSLAEQFEKQHILSKKVLKTALFLLLLGFLKKYAIGDLLFDLISKILDYPVNETPGSLLAFGILLYSAQQYADFSGGIDIVSGISLLYGISLAPNFRQPYFSTSLGDFWRRWHISLGAFMRDYVFYPLALTKPMMELGKKAGKKYGKHLGRVLPACIANIVVFILVGVWHGPQMHYLIWGLYNGIIIALSDLLAPLFNKLSDVLHINRETKGFKTFQIIRTFIIVNIGWYFDRIEDIRVAFNALWITISKFKPGMFIYSLMNTINNNSAGPLYTYGSLLIAFISILIVFVISVVREKQMDIIEIMDSKPMLKVISVTSVLFLILFSFVFVQNAGGFLYANF